MAVEHSARPDHVEMGLGQQQDGGAVGHVGQYELVPRRSDTLQRSLEGVELPAAGRRLGILGPGEVGHDPLQLHRAESAHLGKPLLDGVGQKPQASHSGVQFEVTGDIDTVFGAEGFQMSQEVESRNDRVQGISHQGGGVAAVKTPENEDGGLDAGLSEARAFRHRGDAEAPDPFVAQGAGGFDVAVAVSVGLHHREDLHIGAHQAAHRAQVVRARRTGQQDSRYPRVC